MATDVEPHQHRDALLCALEFLCEKDLLEEFDGKAKGDLSRESYQYVQSVKVASSKCYPPASTETEDEKAERTKAEKVGGEKSFTDHVR